MRSPRLGLVSSEEWAELSEDERTAVAVLDLHLHDRFKQRRFDPFLPIDGESCGVFLVAEHVQGLLRRVRSRKVGRDFARTIIPTLIGLGLIEDAHRTLKPRRRDRDPDDDERGGQHAQTSLLRSRWWRVYRVVPILDVLLSSRWGAYGRKRPVLQERTSLSLLLRCQGLISKPKRLRHARPGSVQAAFAATGPP